MKLAHRALLGFLAGGAGSAVLNAVTYADMLLRDRPASDLPQRTANAIVGPLPPNRLLAAGMLLGYADGFGAGALLGLVRREDSPRPWFVAGMLLAAVTRGRLRTGPPTSFLVQSMAW